MLILALSVPVLTIFINLVKTCFEIFFHKSAISKIKSGIILEYIIAFREILKKSLSDEK